MDVLSYISIFITYVVIIIVGCITPYVTRKNIIFGVYVPKEYSNDKEIQKIRRSYVYNFLISSIVLLAILVLKLKNINIAIGGFFIEIILMYISYLRAHSQVAALKAEKEWSKDKKQAAVVDIDFRKKPVVVSPLWFIIPALIFIFTVIVGIYVYPYLPSKIPMHFNSQGIVDSYAKKSIGSAFLINIIQFFIIGIMFVCYKAIESAKQQVDPSNPEASVEKNLRFRKLWSGMIIITAVIISIIFMLAAFMVWGILKEINLANMLIVIVTTIIIIVPIVLAIITGQGGERIRIEGEDKSTKSFDRDDDKYWKLGMFYYNPNDPAIFLEKRFGVGWTVNYGNPIVWIGMIIFILIMAAIILLPMYLMK